MLGTASCVASDGLPSSTPCRSHPWKGCQSVCPLSSYRIFLKDNDSINHFYSQTKRMLTQELFAAVVDTGEHQDILVIFLNLVTFHNWG